ncbi:MAG: pyridoxamine 5'-phosphate oxidase family protein [Anaerolineae bacterium]|nr:pyridoxamine 5'-phosphate oxidase family protein [Anaerolineae bacterium]
MSQYEITPQNRVSRVPDRGHYDTETIYNIIDEGLICHVGLVQDDQPVVIPTIHARKGNTILLHGATKSRLMQYAQSGQKICITITLLDGLVLARSVFNHSMNYRSVVLFGRGQIVPDEEKMECLKAFTDHLLPGRWDDARQPTATEMKATTIVAIPIELASAKVRVGPPKDEAEDYDLPIWAGVLPIKQQILPPQDDPKLAEGISTPDYIREYVNKH